MNPLLLTDSYKFTHHNQYPPGTTGVYSYLESRGGMFPKTLFFGLQYILKEYLSKQVTLNYVLQAKKMVDAHIGPDIFNEKGWRHILDKYDGYLPLRIKAVDEGSLIPTGNVLMTIENTDPDCYWLTNFVESLLLHVWYPTTVATLSFFVKQRILDALEVTGDPKTIDFRLHDFGFRGVSSVESAGIGGAAHLLNFKGTDTFCALKFIMDYYLESEVVGFSIPATEHSTITSWGKDHELDAYDNFLKAYPSGTIACVSDSYDIFNACSNLWGDKLRNAVWVRDGVVVIRPDSGNPGPVVLGVLERLADAFGHTVNDKGFRVLHPNVQVIQGDGVNYETIGEILSGLRDNGWSADNLSFGMGGGLLQSCSRDTQKFAIKCSSVTVAGQQRNVFKDPITDSGKRSKAGRLGLYTSSFGYYTGKGIEDPDDKLKEVFLNGKVTNEVSFMTIRERVHTSEWAHRNGF